MSSLIDGLVVTFAIVLALERPAIAQLKLSNTPVAGGNVLGFILTADGSRVLYIGDLTTDTVSELYSASTSAAGSQLKLSNTPVTGGNVFSFVPTPDGSRVLYQGDLTTNGVTELYSASTSAAGTQIKLNNTPVTGGNVGSFDLTADGSRVLYRGDLTTFGVIELYSASTSAAGTQIKLNNTPVTNGDISSFDLTADGSRVLYDGDLTTLGVRELYSASTSAAGTQIKLNNTPVTGGQVSLFVPTPDGSRVLYTGDLTTDGARELYSASTSVAGTQITLNNTPVTGGNVSSSFVPTPDGSRVLYNGDLTTDGVSELYSAFTSAAGSQIKLNNTPVTGGNVSSSFVPTPDGSRVLYLGDLATLNVFELYSASTSAAGSQIKLSNTPVAGGNVVLFVPTPDSSRVLYRGDLTTDNVTELYSASTSAPGTQIRLTDLMGSDDVDAFILTPDSRFAVFWLNTVTGTSLWFVDVLGTSAPVRLTPEIAHVTAILQFKVTADSRKVIFAVDLDTDDVFEIYSSDLPAPKSATARAPTLTIKGGKSIKTSKSRITIRGAAESSAGIGKVEFKIPGGKFQKAKGTTRWKATIRLTAKRTVVKFLATAADGQISPVSRVTIIRK